MYVSLQGKMYAARVTSGVPAAFRYLGNVPEGGLQFSTDVFSHSESETGQRLEDLRIPRSKSARINLTLEDWSKENLALALYGASSTIASGSVSNEALPTGLVAGDYVRTAKPNISALVVTDSAGTSATLTAGTDYEITSATHGTIKFLDVGSYTQPFKLAYSNAEATNVNMFTQAAQELWLRFDGIETVPGGSNKLIELYRVVFDPTSDMQLKHQENGRFPLAGSALYDATKAADAVLGQFGRVVLL